MRPKKRKWFAPFPPATGHISQKLLCVGRLLNYEDFGGGDTGDKEVDSKSRFMGLNFEKFSAAITAPRIDLTIKSLSNSA